MTDEKNKEQLATSIMEFCSEKLDAMGIDCHVFFAEVDNQILSRGKSDIKFDMRLIKIIFNKNNMTPIIETTDRKSFVEILQKLIDKE